MQSFRWSRAMSNDPVPAVKPGGENAALRLETFLPYRLNVAASVVSQQLAEVYSARFGIDIPEWRVIATLGRFGEATAKAVGLHSHMHKTKVSRAVTALEARGLVVRKANPADMREAILSLTAAGTAMLGDITPLALGYQARLRDRLGGEAFRALEEALDRLAEGDRTRATER
jgi:DNA-binding MarR family transcriptional regulator